MRGSENLDPAQDLVRRSRPTLPDGRRTDEDDASVAGYLSLPTGEHDPSMLAEEFDKEKSDIGQKLSMYHVSRKKVRDSNSTKLRYDPPLLNHQNFAFHAKRLV